MEKLRLWQFLALIFASIVSSKCCMLSRGVGMECHLRRASFGGRLVFMGNNGVRSGNFPALASRGRVLTFQTPPAHLRSHMGFGRGQIWIGRKTCQGSNSQALGHCPWTDVFRPCLDTKLPCNTGQGCASFPCENDGRCIPGADGVSFTCECISGFTGLRCENAPEQTACNPNPCQNGGACILQGINGFSCTCISGFTGVTCGKECHLRRASFGGRLVFMGNNGVRSGIFSALASRGRVLIFQTPPAHLRSHMGFGRGQIWIGRRTCQGSNLQVPGHCPWTAGDRPCLDTKLPCNTDFVSEAPSYAQSNPLEFPEVSENSIKVSWPAWSERTDLGVGPITGYKILYRQVHGIFREIFLDRNIMYYRFDGLTSGTTYEFRVILVREGIPSEGRPSNIQNVTTPCGALEHVDLRVETMPMPGLSLSRFNISWRLPNLTGNCDISYQQITLHRLDVADCLNTTRTKPRDHPLQTGTRSTIFNRLRSYSLHKVTYLARNPAGTYVTSQLNRTAETIPFEAPRNLTQDIIGNKVLLKWKEPRCRFRNGEIKEYSYTIIRNGRMPFHRTKREKEHTLRGVSIDDEWVFRVKACTAAGCGPSAEASGART